MAIPVVMPKLGMVMSEGTLTRWTRAKGEAVRAGEVIAEIETEKISYELEATADGIVHPLAEDGATLPVDGLMGYLLAEGEAAPEPKAARPAPSAGAPAGAAAPCGRFETGSARCRADGESRTARRALDAGRAEARRPTGRGSVGGPGNGPRGTGYRERRKGALGAGVSARSCRGRVILPSVRPAGAARFHSALAHAPGHR